MSETQEENRVCPICQRPKRAGTAGSITQWISVCRCNLQEDRTDEKQETLQICADCRKRVNPARGGTITQWIFSENFCKCDNPRLVPVEAHEIHTNRVEADEEHYADEIGLDLDPSVFPVERYKPLQFIGKGALGEVYLCRDILLKKKVAVKCLLNLTSDRVVSFQNEAKIVSKLNHESIISVNDFGTTNGGRPFMVMEYFPGKSLQEIIAESGKIDEIDAIELFSPICRSLVYLHQCGVFHRDLKPSNVLVMVRPGGSVDVRLIDFGLSKTTQDVQSKTLVDGHTIVGTPGYMSPDQIRGRAYDARSEVYSLGCMMFETVTGKQPYEGATALEVLNLHINAPVPSVNDFQSAISPEFSRLIEKCLSKEGGDRFNSISELESALSSCRRGRDITEPIEEPLTHYASASSTPFTQSAPGKAQTWGIVMLGFVLMVSISFVCWTALKPSEPEVKIGLARRSIAVVSARENFQQIEEETNILNDQPQLGTTSGDALADMSQLGPSDRGVPSLLNTGPTINLNFSNSVTKGLRVYANLPMVNPKLSLEGSKVVAGDATLIASMNPVEVNFLNCRGVTDDTLRELSKNSTIIKLTLDGCKGISREGFKCLKQMADLSILSVNNCDLSNEDIKPISGIKALTDLSLNGNENVDSSGLQYLGKRFRLAPAKGLKPVNIFVDLGPIGPGQKLDLEKNGVHVFYTRSDFSKYGVQ